MKRRNLFLLLFLFTGYTIIAQQAPSDFSLGKEKSLSKISQTNANNPANNSVSDIITIGDTIWLGTGKGVSLSTDRGETWTNFNSDDAFGSNSTSAIGYNNGVFWVALAYNTEANGENVQTGGGFAYTTNNGNTWTKIPQPVDDPSDSLISYGINDGVNLPRVRALPVTVPQQNLSFDIAFTPGTIWITSFAGGLRRSNDNGASWQRVLLPSDRVNEISPEDTIKFNLQPVPGNFGPEGYLNHRTFSVISTDPSTLFVGTAGGINKSTDGGISWRKLTATNQQNPISGNFVVALAYDTSSSTIWAATWRAEGQTEFYGVSSSSDGGENWQTFLEDERVHNFGFVNGVNAGVIAAADNGAFRSKDNGVSWILPPLIKDDQTDILLPTNVYYSAGSQGNDIWLGSADGLARLSETGLMWSGNWKVFFASQPLASKTETYAFPNPFSPKIDLLKIKYSTGSSGAPVTIRIFDFGMNYIRTVIQNAQRGGPAHVVDDLENTNGVIDYWDGKDDNGNIVPNGVYFYRVEVGSDEPVFGKILVIQ
ncbi:MAG: hypothetical protein R6W90_08070 [Ignavibacteriaceae bacterium]